MSERVEFRNSRGLKLVGIIEPVKTDKIVILAHGFTGDKDEWGRFVKLAEELKNGGFASLRFDFAGSGESDPAGITVQGEVDDLKSAIKFVRQKGYNKIGLFGHSLGGLCSILASDNEISTMALTAPVTHAKTPREFLKPQLRKEIEEKGHIILKKHREFRVEKQYLLERESVNQKEILSKLNCPVFIIQGDKDEHIPLEHTKSAMKFLPKQSKLEIIEGADHGLKNEWDSVVSLTVNWFKEHL